jgi:hypothetical protein
MGKTRRFAEDFRVEAVKKVMERGLAGQKRQQAVWSQFLQPLSVGNHPLG